LAKKTKAVVEKRLLDKEEVLNGLRCASNCFEQWVQKNDLFKPEFETSQRINKALEEAVPLTKSAVIEILQSFNDIQKVKHADGIGWIDYGFRLCHYLRLNGFITKFEDKNLRLEEPL